MLTAGCMGMQGLVRGVPSGNIYCLMAYHFVYDSETKEVKEWFLAYGNEDKKMYKLGRAEVTVV